MSTESIPEIKRKSLLRRLITLTGWILLILIILVMVTVFLANSYLNSNKNKIFENLSFLNNGSIQFKEAHISVINNFPQASIALKDVHLHDSLYYKHKQELVRIGELDLILDINHWRSKEVGVKGIVIRDSDIRLTTLPDGYNLLNSVIKKKDIKNETSPPQGNLTLTELKAQDKSFTIDTKNIDVKIIDTNIQLLDSVKTQYIVLHANEIDAGYLGKTLLVYLVKDLQLPKNHLRQKRVRRKT